MARLASHRASLAVALGLVAPIAVAAAFVPLRASFAGTASALVLVAVVVAVAVYTTRLAGFVAAASAALSFDFFLTEPYERFAITHRDDLETAIALFVVGVAVTELAARSRHHREVADEETDYVGLLYYLSELVAAGAPTQQVIDQASAELIDLLHLRSCRYVVGAATAPAATIEHDGSIALGLVRWGAEETELPGRELELVVHSRGQVRGRFILVPTPGRAVPVPRRIVAAAIADQVGAALTPNLRSA